MNLTTDPWIPVKTNQGVKKVSLLEIFKDPKIIDLEVTPPERVAIIRLLLCITHAGLADKTHEPNPKNWGEEEKIQIQASSTHYLENWGKAFAMEGEQAFLQIPSLTGKKEGNKKTSVTKFIFTKATGNNNLTFDKTGENEIISPDLVARWLITYQNFSTSGISGSATLSTGEVLSGNQTKGPCASGDPAHVIIIGETLLETIWKNLLTNDQIKRLNGDTTHWELGRPVWESMPTNKQGDTPKKTNILNGYLGRLCPLPIFTKIHWKENKCDIAAGVTYNSRISEPSTGTEVKTIKKKEEILRISPPQEGGIWRQYGALLLRKQANNRKGPPVLENLSNNANQKIWCGAINMGKNGGKVTEWREWEITIPQALLNGINLQKYEIALQYASQVRAAMRASAKIFYTECGGNKKIEKERPSANNIFWQECEQLNQTILLPSFQKETSEKENPWNSAVRKAGRNALAKSLNPSSAKQIKAYAKAMKTFEAYSYPKKENENKK